MTGASVAVPAWKYALSWYTNSGYFRRTARRKESSPYRSTQRIVFSVNHVRHNAPQTPSSSNGKITEKKMMRASPCIWGIPASRSDKFPGSGLQPEIFSDLLTSRCEMGLLHIVRPALIRTLFASLIFPGLPNIFGYLQKETDTWLLSNISGRILNAGFPLS